LFADDGGSGRHAIFDRRCVLARPSTLACNWHGRSGADKRFHRKVSPLLGQLPGTGRQPGIAFRPHQQCGQQQSAAGEQQRVAGSGWQHVGLARIVRPLALAAD
jgi:hypothetical protein